jgi:hypothetical protein
LTRLAQLSNIMQGYQIPTTTETKLNMSPLSALSTVGAGAAGLFSNQIDPTTKKPITGTSLWDQIKGQFNTPTSGLPTNPNYQVPATDDPNLYNPTEPNNPIVPPTDDPNLYNPVEPAPYEPADPGLVNPNE